MDCAACEQIGGVTRQALGSREGAERLGRQEGLQKVNLWGRLGDKKTCIGQNKHGLYVACEAGAG